MGITSLLNPLADLVARVIMYLHAGLGSLFGPDTGLAWGLSIALLVIIIRLLLVPLALKQVHAQRKMAQLAPQITELRKKYKNDKQRLNEETMKFYKENGANPLSGCLPMIPQMIIFFSLFYVLRAIADWKQGGKLSYGLTESVMQSAQQAKIFGVHLGDKLLFAHQSVPTHVAVVIVITVLISASTTFMTVRQSSKRGLTQTGVDPNNPMAGMQKNMMYIVPFFSLTGLYWQYGLVLYWVTTNLWTLGQQYVMFRNWTTEPAQPAGATAGAAGGQARAARGPAHRAPGGTRNGTASSAKAAAGGTRTASAPKSATGNTATGAGNGRPGAPRAPAAGNAAGRGRTGSAARDTPASDSGPPNGQNGAAKRGLLRLGRQKPESAPEPEAPATKVVRQQPVRQARSKRSGKR